MAFFVELTNPVHGGEGWELGEVLWSPVSTSWNNIMQTPKSGDIIIHSLKDSKRNINHRFWGVSIVDGSYKVIEEMPPIPGRWGGYDRYYQIPLKGYVEFNEKKNVQDFLDLNKMYLKSIIPQHSFYTETQDIKTAQKYLAKVSEELFDRLKEFIGLDLESINYIKNAVSHVSREGDVEEQSTKDKSGKTTRVTTTVERIVRDTRIIKKLKLKYEDKCQICGKQIFLPSGKRYSEGHHLKKLGGVHQGPDIEENIIILCPNHHTEFDYGIIAIDPDTKKIRHIDPENEYNGKSLAYIRDDLDNKFLKYHREKIFGLK